ncbi:MAG TPA: hypothetical protein PKW55_05390 [Spirochaetota bacterium]|nr:hypothetical protein [Spirochaetota bacterium]HOM37614.1 hypothetical protein [Spirochaetota bacterium]HPQ49415.1 hypothetical protein [Spirochaetota bacterium]
MKKIIFLAVLVFAVISFAQEEKKDVKEPYKDKGNATKEGYTNSTYNIDFKLPEAKWMLTDKNTAMINTNGKVAEYWETSKNIRVVIAIEDSPERIITIADRKEGDLLYIFKSLRIVTDREWMRKGNNYVYFRAFQGEDMSGGRYSVRTYFIFSPDNRDVKISLIIMAPLDRAYKEKELLGAIYNNFNYKPATGN